MKKMNKRFVAGTAFALGAAATLTGCCMFPQPSVYGPAPSTEVETAEEKTTAEEKVTGTTVSDETFETDIEIQPAVYGPPDYFEVEEEIQPDVYGPPDAFNVEDEVLEDVYGPPDVFD